MIESRAERERERERERECLREGIGEERVRGERVREKDRVRENELLSRAPVSILVAEKAPDILEPGRAL